MSSKNISISRSTSLTSKTRISSAMASSIFLTFSIFRKKFYRRKVCIILKELFLLHFELFLLHQLPTLPLNKHILFSKNNNDQSTLLFFSNSIEYVARPCVAERKSVAYPNISFSGTSARTIFPAGASSIPLTIPRRRFRSPTTSPM